MCVRSHYAGTLLLQLQYDYFPVRIEYFQYVYFSELVQLGLGN